MRIRFLHLGAFIALVLGFGAKLQAHDDFEKPISMSRSDIFSSWSSGVPWMSGVRIGAGEGYNGSIAFGANFFSTGSTFDPENAMAVEIRFSAIEQTLAQTYRKDLDYELGGVGVFNGSVWDVSDPVNPRRLNVLFVENETAGKAADLIWNPDDSGDGGREYLFIMNSTYDSSGKAYADSGYAADVVYAWWPRVEAGHTLYETDPATLSIGKAHVDRFSAVALNMSMELSWQYNEPEGDGFNLYRGTETNPQTIIASLAITDRNYSDNGLTTDANYYYRIEAVASDDSILHRSKEITGVPQNRSKRVELYGYLNNRSSYGDIWGYTDPDGNEYALLSARYDGISIIDIGGSTPVEVGYAPGVDSHISFPDSKDIKVYDHYAILVNEKKPVQIFDIDDVTKPVQVSTIYIGGSHSEDGGAHNAYVEGNFLYVVGGHGDGKGNEGWGLSIFDISDPRNPEARGTRHAYYYHDFYVKNDIGYASAGWDGVDILDLSNKDNPKLINNFDYDGQWIHNATASEDGNYLYVGDEIGNVGNWTRIYDISDLMSPILVSEIIVDSRAITHNSYEKDGYLYIAHYTEGLRIFDMADKSNPKPVAYFDTYLPEEFGFRGAWSVYPYFASGKIVVSDMQSGLFVLILDPTLSVPSPGRALPSDYFLTQNYPNPFNASTVIGYGLPTDGDVTLTIHDLLGHEVATLTDGYRSAGSHSISWHSGDHPSGIYFARLTAANGYRQTIKLTLLK